MRKGKNRTWKQTRIVTIPAAATVNAPYRLWTANALRKAVTVYPVLAFQVAGESGTPGIQFRAGLYYSLTRDDDGVDMDLEVFSPAGANTLVEILETFEYE